MTETEAVDVGLAVAEGPALEDGEPEAVLPDGSGLADPGPVDPGPVDGVPVDDGPVDERPGAEVPGETEPDDPGREDPVPDGATAVGPVSDGRALGA